MDQIEMVKRALKKGSCAFFIPCPVCPCRGCVKTMNKRKMPVSFASAQILLKEWLDMHNKEGKQFVFPFEK